MQAALQRTQCASKMAADILHGMFTKEFLASHTIAGGNSAEKSLDPELVPALIGNGIFSFQKREPVLLHFCVYQCANGQEKKPIVASDCNMLQA